MKALTRSLRPWSRLRSIVSAGGERLSRAARLMKAAGAGPRPLMEALEERQLLFTLTITPDLINPATGVGTATAFFGYTIPVFDTATTFTPQPDIITDEDFADENRINWASGNVFGQSLIQLLHTISPPANVRVTGANGPPPTFQPLPETNFLFVQISAGQSMIFRKVDNPNNPSAGQGMKSFQVDIGSVNGSQGLNLDNIRVVLRFEGTVVGSFTGSTLGQLNTTAPGTGVGTFVFASTNPEIPQFTEIEFLAFSGPNDPFGMDNIRVVTGSGDNVQVVSERIFGAWLTFTGPVNATVQLLDLYGRDMRSTIALGQPPGANFNYVDPDNDGVPNWNDGIGRIVLAGVDERSAITLVGGTIQNNINATADFVEIISQLPLIAFSFTVTTNLTGIFDAFEQAGYGFRVNPQTGATSGLPPSGGSVLVGSPNFRNNTSAAAYNPYGQPTSGFNFNFNRANEGIQIIDGSDMGSIFLHGALHGSSRFFGFVHSIYTGYQLGSISVRGDLGSLVVGSDAGVWEVDADFPGLLLTGRSDTTGGQLIVERTLGEFTVAGRNVMSVTVRGDLNSPNIRPARDVLNYFEREHPYQILRNQTPQVTLRALIANNGWLATAIQNAGGIFAKSGQNPIVGNSFWRNDTILSAEWVGNVGTATQIHGNIGGGDPVHTADDTVDVYAFAVDGTTEVSMEITTGFSDFFTDLFPGVNARVVDNQGRVIATSRFDDRATTVGLANNSLASGVQNIRFTPDSAGVYYLVLIRSVNFTVNEAVEFNYFITMNGLASTTAGMFRSGASLGTDNADEDATITMLAGSIGSVHVGTAVTLGNGNEADPILAYNDEVGEADDRMRLLFSTLSTPGRLYSITAGSDIEGISQFIIGGDFGTLTTGLSEIPGERGPAEGDIGNFTLQVGGRIAMLDIKGAIAVQQDPPGDPNLNIIGPLTIRTGTAGGNGDIGMIRVGEHVRAGFLTVVTSPGSTIGAFLVSQDTPADDLPRGIYLGNGVEFITGFGSDVRFVDFPNIDELATQNARIPLIGGQSVLVTDDGGGTARIEITSVPSGVIAGFIRVLPVDPGTGVGVAIAQIEADLTGGRALVITSLAPSNQDDVISIGTINILGADAGSAVRILGPGHVDVWRIIQTGGETLGSIINETPLGDIVSIDVAGLASLELQGNLGRTQSKPWGPRLLGPFLGVSDDAGDVGEELGITGIMAGDWNGELYRPIDDFDFEPGDAFLSDIGSPISPFLNGLVVRGGDVAQVFVGGSAGDVLVLDGSLVDLVVNTDLSTPLGGFNGILGSVYASGDISSVNVGDGIAKFVLNNPFGATGIFAGDDILNVTGNESGGPSFIRGMIVASNNVIDDQFGLVNVSLPSGGGFIDAYVAVEQLDGWFIGLMPFTTDNTLIQTGNIGTVSGTNAGFFRSRMYALDIDTVTFTGGVWDASLLSARNNVGFVQADHFRNSTLQGTDREYAPNAIIVGEDLDTLITGLTGDGDISDLQVEVLGSIVSSVTASTISRMTLNVNRTITLLTTALDLRASNVSGGTIEAVTVGRNIRTSNIRASGPLVAVSAGDSITGTLFTSNGPDARIDSITAVNLLTGEIAAAGPIAMVDVMSGDFRARVLTTTARGNVGTLSAGRDLDLETDISGDVTLLSAGRSVGRIGDTPRIMLIRGNLADIDISNGQLYSDIRIGQSLTGAAIIGPSIHLPTASNLGDGTIVAFGRIENVRINGDFAGRIISYSNGIGVVTVNDGSTLPGSLIAAYDGDITHVVINRGHLLGDIHADHILYFVTVNASEDGIFGDIGVNPDLNPNVGYNGNRNQLPNGVIANSPIQGPRITAGHNIGRITTSNGSMFEAFVHAGRAIGTITINGDVRNDPFTAGTGTVIGAGSTFFTITVSGSMSDTALLAGVKSFGEDGRPGGVDQDADTNQLGKLGNVDIRGNAQNVVMSAGFFAGGDGIYNTGDDAIVPGLSFIRNVLIGGAISNVTAFSDFPIMTLTPGVIAGGLSAPPMDPLIAGGIPPGGTELFADAPFIFTTLSGETGTIQFSGPGRVFWDANTNRVVLISTRAETNLQIVSNSGVLTNFLVVSNDEASMGNIEIGASLVGDSAVVVDNNIVSLQVNNAGGNPRFSAGGNMRHLTIGNMSGGLVSARFGRFVNIVGDFGLSTDDDEITARYTALGDVVIGGQNAGAILVDRDVFSLTVHGAMNRAVFRAGSDVGFLTAGSMSETRISVRDTLGPVTVSGNVFDTSIMAGGDLGEDGTPGGGGFNADSATTGSIGPVSIGGDFVESDIVAGMLRGPDGFFGTDDDSVAAGRSTIADVTIAGQAVGSNLGSEAYRIAATGTIGTVLAQGQTPPNDGNFKVGVIATSPVPIVVNEIRVAGNAGVFEARIIFNQAMDSSTIAASLLIQEVRDGGAELFNLVQGAHYIVAYDPATNAAIITFQKSVTDRNLPQSGDPGPGVFRFTFAGDTLRAAVAQARLDGDADGFVDPAGDDFSGDAIVGDAGDKVAEETIFLPHRVDYYAAADLNLVLDGNRFPDGLPDVNKSFTVRGAIGDHPDNDPDAFGFSGDVDVYRLTLQAGQILQLGPMGGTALFAGVSLYNAGNNLQNGDTPDSLLLASDVAGPGQLTTGSNFLIKTTGTYYLVVGPAGFAFSIPGFVPNIGPVSGAVGDYNFSIRVFDDGDSGFAGDTDSGNGANLPTPPTPDVFAGPDQLFDTADDIVFLPLDGFIFQHDRGADQIANTIDDVVFGSDNTGITVTRSDVNRITTTINSAIGTPGHIGVPGDKFEPDADVFRLNNGLPIAPGTQFRITVKLSESGADLGSRNQNSLVNWNSEVQFGIFEITNSSGVGDGQLVFSPTDFKSSGGLPGVIASLQPFQYGYDDNGDFFINFVAPGSLNASTVAIPASYALYIQGVFNTDYTIEIVQQGFGTWARPRQNVFIETRGGELDWLEVGGLKTAIGAFDPASLGMTGSINGQPVRTFILNRLVSRLTQAFAAAGVDVVISTNPNAFEFQDFSTVFLSSSNDPIGFFADRIYGTSEHSDPFNTDRNDEAVVFTPAFGTLGFTPSIGDVNEFVDSLTAAVGRRVGELIGLRLTTNYPGPGGDIMAANSPENFGDTFSFLGTPRNLSGRFDLNGESDFFLGQQSSMQLLQKLVRP